MTVAYVDQWWIVTVLSEVKTPSTDLEETEELVVYLW